MAYRMALLNPQLFDKVTTETDGVVLIDEIDLHLHPAWQRRIIHTLSTLFPRIQFVITTHAPSVISSVNKDDIILLSNGTQFSPNEPTYGKDANAILTQVMHVPVRQDDAAAVIELFHDCLASGKQLEAEKHLQALKALLGENDPAVVSAEIALDLEMME